MIYTSSLKDILNAAFQSVTADFCKTYIKDCGYYIYILIKES